MSAVASPPLVAAPAVVAPTVAPATRQRLDSIDLLRGVVMVIMVLDHTRDFVHGPALHSDPTNLATTSAAIFMTRWITHFCAPVFVFLAGVSVYLQKMRGKTASELSRFLLARGMWLIFVEIVVLHVLVWFSLDMSFVGPLQVIWAFGWSMFVLALLVHVPRPVVAAFGVATIALHNLWDGVLVTSWTNPTLPVPTLSDKVWMVLHQPGFFPVSGSGSPLVWLQYPLIPWVGVMAAGYACGAIFEVGRERRIRITRIAGLAMVAAFVLLRASNVYGDPSPWSAQPSALFTVLSFINTTKYPASLLYLLMTLGPALVALSWFESSEARRAGPFGATAVGRLAAPLVTFGRVPLFFYLLQWPLAHTSAIVANIVAGRSFDYLFSVPPAFFNLPSGLGFRLWVVYVCWASIIAIEYPLCRWFAGVKQRRRDPWLSYL